MDEDYIKQRLRKLKKLENKIRFGDGPSTKSLVWDEFFDLKSMEKRRAKYSLIDLMKMEKEELKRVIDEYFYSIYYIYYRENGFFHSSFYDPAILVKFGLSIDAGYEDIKKRFRQLAKEYHPDTGGDSKAFIEMMENYKKLME